jgi:hypothetical protein
MKRCRKSWRRRLSIMIGQMSKGFREKRKIFMQLKMGRSNEMANGGEFLIVPPHPLIQP